MSPHARIINPLWGDDWPAVRALWPLDANVAHVNHGSFGAVMSQISEAQNALRAGMDANPMRFFLHEEPPAVAAARERAAMFLGADPAGLALVPNATAAASTVLAAVDLRPDDEVVLTDHTYGAVRLAVERFTGRSGASIRDINLEINASPDDVVAAVLAATTERTRLVCLDYITSTTAVVLPVEAVAAAIADSGAALFVDAAHAPGQVPVDLSNTAADFWTGNFHKWPCAPRGTAALYVSPRYRDQTGTLVVSWNEDLGYPAAFDLGGTQDQTAWMVLDVALDAMDALGWPRMRAHGQALAAYGQQVVADALGVRDDELWADGTLWMRCVPLPAGVAATVDSARALWRTISDELNCEVGVTTWRGRGLLRVSAHAYNAPADYERLALGLRRLFA